MLRPEPYPWEFRFNWPDWEIWTLSCNQEEMSPALETCLDPIICHQWIPGRTYVWQWSPVSREWYLLGWVYLLGHLVAALIRDSEPHETVCWTWQRGVLCLCLLFWTHGESLSILTHSPCCQTHKFHMKSLQAPSKRKDSPLLITAPELPSLSVTHASSSAVNLSSHVSNEFPIKLAVWPSSVLFSLFSFDYTQVIFLEAGD